MFSYDRLEKRNISVVLMEEHNGNFVQQNLIQKLTGQHSTARKSLHDIPIYNRQQKVEHSREKQKPAVTIEEAHLAECASIPKAPNRLGIHVREELMGDASTDEYPIEVASQYNESP